MSGNPKSGIALFSEEVVHFVAQVHYKFVNTTHWKQNVQVWFNNGIQQRMEIINLINYQLHPIKKYGGDAKTTIVMTNVHMNGKPQSKVGQERKIQTDVLSATSPSNSFVNITRCRHCNQPSSNNGILSKIKISDLINFQ